ncbi:hypothetical protein FRB94_006400 [Tulasnella sp. JGI-2019a]|nr:hypothetical protein FRB94_006400 [Tulasnella sp. JGI-2019a]KAG9037909.1 hypothetical protein FRB95_003749 [Tulasnella sp. JGI-2019a]
MSDIINDHPNPYITSEVKRSLRIWYGARCALTKSDSYPQMSCVVPHSDSGRSTSRQSLTELKNLGLVPLRMTLASGKNLIPLDASTHIRYDNDDWAFLPTESVLMLYIAFEEYRLCVREATNPDPSRLPYDRSYTTFPPNATFNAYFVRTHPPFLIHDDDVPTVQWPDQPFPVRELITSVNIIVRRAPSFIITHPNPKAREAMTLAAYLQLLWFAAPGSFRQIARPQSIPFHIDEAGKYFETTEPELWTKLQTTILGDGLTQYAEGADAVGAVEINISELGQDIPGEGCGVPSDDSSLHSSQEFDVEEGNIGDGRLTSNDRAYLKYHTVLGGPILDS